MSRTHLDAGFIGYGRQEVRDDDVEAVAKVLRGERLTQGAALDEFEAALCEATGAEFAIAVNSGTAALQLAMAAVGIGPGKKVVTSANTFLASATTAIWCGAEVEFIDIDPHTMNMDLDALEIRLAQGGVDCVVPVHFAGLPCDMQRLVELKVQYDFKLIDDACHALGGTYECAGASWRIGEFPICDATVLSFHPVKLITTGEGGAVLLHDKDVAERVRKLRHHGSQRDESARPFADSTACPPWFTPMTELGGNSRLSDIGAALGTSQLKRLHDNLESRRSQVLRYDMAFANDCFTGLQAPPRNDGHAWHLYVIRCKYDERDQLLQYLLDNGIGAQLHYYPVPMNPYFVERYGVQEVPAAEEYARRGLSIPLYPCLPLADQQHVIEVLEKWCSQRGATR
ncbi:MAG: dTDP-4-amino-4,6-dideoxygalactose transaminase [Planctomycetota bacterium]|jgi:dTDP-4-amino-4,6-dideoxygalactose transaminase